MASLHLTTDKSFTLLPSSSRKYINDIPPDLRSKLCTEIDYTLHRNEGYWQKLGKFIFSLLSIFKYPVIYWPVLAAIIT